MSAIGLVFWHPHVMGGIVEKNLDGVGSRQGSTQAIKRSPDFGREFLHFL